MIPPYPLAWPERLPRTARPISGSFKTTLPRAIENVEKSLELFAKDSGQLVTNIAITSMKAGLSSAQPSDTGVSIWFEWDGEQRCVAVDRYDKLEDNVQAIHHVIEARRTELRHGGLNIARQTFKSFTALPHYPVDWRKLLGFDKPGQIVTKDMIEAAYRLRAKTAHPDKPGGSAAEFQLLNKAKADALAAFPA